MLGSIAILVEFAVRKQNDWELCNWIPFGCISSCSLDSGSLDSRSENRVIDEAKLRFGKLHREGTEQLGTVR